MALAFLSDSIIVLFGLVILPTTLSSGGVPRRDQLLHCVRIDIYSKPCVVNGCFLIHYGVSDLNVAFVIRIVRHIEVLRVTLQN